MDAQDPQIRHQLIALAKKGPRARTTAWSKEMPTEWQPTQVNDPRTGTPFTEAGAWQFIEEKLELGQCLEEVELQKPPGRKGYVMQIHLEDGRPALYVKLQLGSGKIIGRSFHYSRQ